ncbi:MAG: PRC-barrel domain-containing protein [Candidatus Micrarchaeota archaeon]
MSLKLSQLMGKDVYSDTADYIGKVHDIILDLQKGEVVRLTLEPIRAGSKEEAKRIFKEKTIMYKSVKAVEKIVIISKAPIPEETEEEPEQQVPLKPTPYSFRYRKA